MSPAAYGDLTKLVETFANAKNNIDDVQDQVMMDAATKIESRMKELAPKKTGRLYMSIRITQEPGQVTIGPVGVEYAVYQEFGTATRGEFGGQPYVIKPKTADRLTFKINGHWVSTKMVIHPGIPPHPFARPAFQEYVEELQNESGRRAAGLITGYAA